MNELDTLIAQQAAEMAHPTRVFSWCRHSVATPVSLDAMLGDPRTALEPRSALLVDGEDSWRADRFAPASKPAEIIANADIDLREVIVDDLFWTTDDVAHYRSDWGVA